MQKSFLPAGSLFILIPLLLFLFSLPHQQIVKVILLWVILSNHTLVILHLIYTSFIWIGDLAIIQIVNIIDMLVNFLSRVKMKSKHFKLFRRRRRIQKKKLRKILIRQVNHHPFPEWKMQYWLGEVCSIEAILWCSMLKIKALAMILVVR